MTDTDDYRRLAQQVRQTARAHLAEIRRARLAGQMEPSETRIALNGPKARRRANRHAQSDRPDGASQLDSALADGRIELWLEPLSRVPTDCPVLIDTGSLSEWQAAVTVTAVTPDLLPDPEPEDMVFFGPPAPSATTALPRDEVEAGEMFGPFLPATKQPSALTLLPEMRVVVETAPEIEASVAPSAAPSSESDLALLPGIGPGLIWMLERCGISGLGDLAGTDAAGLAPRLGLVGQIVDLPGWQRFARDQMARRA